jgi:predicted transcriptional regulator YdeE
MDYTIEHKPAFTLTGYGFTIQADFQNPQALIAEKTVFWNNLKTDGRFDKLKKVAKDAREWSVNEVYQGKPWNYFAVETRAEIADATRIIEFPESEYIVVSGRGEASTLFDQLTYHAFGEILPTIPDYAYIGGPNATYREVGAEAETYGEFWVPVVKK